jgi:hypothetical protein
MRKLIVCNIISVDGYYEGPGKDVLALPFDEGFSEYNVGRLRAADALLLGRRSFEGFRSYWPPIADDPDQLPVEREISRLNTAIDRGSTRAERRARSSSPSTSRMQLDPGRPRLVA